MKKLINYIFGFSLILLLATCSEEVFVKQTLELELLADEVHLNIASSELASTTVNIRHGNSGYTVESSDETVATATNTGTGVEIEITAIDEGTAIITVRDAEGMTATIDVTVSVTLPTTPTFRWSGQTVRFDRAGGYAITILSDKIALTDIGNDQRQYILSWTGGLSEGEKTNGVLKVIDMGEEQAINELISFRVLKSDSSGHYIIFSDGSNGGELFFSTE